MRSVATTRSGRIICAGTIKRGHGFSEGIVFALKPDGRLDRSFGRRGSVRFAPRPANFTGLSDVKVLGSGKILVSGAFKGRFLLARLTARGKLDKSFGGGDGRVVAGLDRCGCAYLAKIATTHRHKIVMLAGYRYGNAYFGLARFTPRGRLDRSFRGGGYFHSKPPRERDRPQGGTVPGFHQLVTDLVIRDNGRIAISAMGDSKARGFTVRQFLSNGKPDRSFFGDGIFTRNYSPISGARSVMVQRNGKLLAAGFTVDGVVVVRFKG